MSRHRTPSPAAREATGLVFDAIAITSASREQGAAYRAELEQRQRLGLLPAGTLIVEVPDPAGMRVGSGGATLNALTIVSLQLCAAAGYTEINERFLRNKRILILHSGGDSQRMPICSVRGKAFTSLPALASQHEHVMAPIDYQIDRLHAICKNAPVGGVVITATDVLLLLPDDYTWGRREIQGATGLAIYAEAALGSNHGVYVVPENETKSSHLSQTPVTSIMQKATFEELKKANAVRPDGTVLIDSGIIYLSNKMTAEFLRLSTVAPFDSCTDAGLDSGVIPFRFELYTDILYCMNPSMSYEQYLASPPAAKDADPAIVAHAREALWNIFRPYPFYIISSPGAAFTHLGTIAEYMHFLTHDSPFRAPFHLQQQVRTFMEYPHLCSNGVLINNLLLGHGRVDKGALVEHSVLRGNFHIEQGGVASGIRTLAGLHVLPQMVVQEINLSPSRVAAHAHFRHLLPEHESTPSLRVIVVYGVHDGIKHPYTHPKATLCNRPWAHFLAPAAGEEAAHPYPKSHTHLSPNNDVIWAPHIPRSDRTLWNARLFPVLVGDKATEAVLWLQYNERATVHNYQRWKQATRVSLEDILHLSDALSEVHWRQRLSFLVDKFDVEEILLQRENRSLLPIIKRCGPEHRQELLACLDAVASYAAPDMCARALCCIADVLALSYPSTTYSRTGSCRNPQFETAYRLLDEATNGAQQAEAVRELAVVRKTWMSSESPQLIMRAARHYDGAWQRLTKKGVLSVRQSSCGYQAIPAEIRVKVGTWVRVESPVRLDIMGGWSDTPPITFEHGGKVVNVAVKINGENPVGASARTFALQSGSPNVIIVRTGRNRTDDGKDQTVFLRHVHDLNDYNNPVAPAALVKAVLVVMDLVNLTSSTPLQQQLRTALGDMRTDQAEGVGLEIRSWSNLPQGTGLGVSSILAATIVQAIAIAFGRNYELRSLCHLVLLVEQYLTTGGGWQDQVGGLYGGFKLSSSAASLPLTVSIHPIPVLSSFIHTFNNHILLIHTGQSRLAKNLLQTVLRCWYQRDDTVTSAIDGLVSSCDDLQRALLKGDLPEVGRFLQLYWDYKKIMATPAPELHQINDAPVEPAHVIALTNAVRPHVHGLSLLGAGGGGFMLLITKEPISKSKPIVEKIVADLNQAHHAAAASSTDDDDSMDAQTMDMVVYDTSVCETGLSIKIDS